MTPFDDLANENLRNNILCENYDCRKCGVRLFDRGYRNGVLPEQKVLVDEVVSGRQESVRGKRGEVHANSHGRSFQMLGAAMKFFLLTQAILLFLCGCYRSNDHQECYEPIYLNETDFDVLFLYGNMENGENLDSLVISQKDSIFCKPGMKFPFLHKEGLGTFQSNLYDVRLEFSTTPRKCLTFKGRNFQEHDIRIFLSYKNIGTCYECMVRGQSVPDGMLYRTTDDLLEQAKPCE